MNIFGRKGKKDAAAAKAAAAASKELCQVLGVPLKQAVRNNPSFDGVPVPAVVRECLDYVGLYGLQMEGIYRVSSPKSRLDELEEMANTGRHHEIIFQDAHEAAGLLKRFLRQLPEHILTPQLNNQFNDTAKLCKCDPMGPCTCPVALQVKELLLKLPTENFHLLGYVFRHAQLVIQQESRNKMGLAALGVLLQAMLSLDRAVLKMFIMNAGSLADTNGKATPLFDGVHTKTYLKPKSIEELRQNPPSTLKEIEDEIFKQQNLLEYLHEKIQQMRTQGCENTKPKEDEMWAVQTGITVLKRRHKALLEEHPNEEEAGTAQKEDESGEDSMSCALLEKQLLAVQIALREEIGDEKRKIGNLLSVLREALQLRTQLPEEEQTQLTTSQQTTNTESQNRPKSIVSTRSSSNGLIGGGDAADSKHSRAPRDDSSQSMGSGNWEELCRAEESRKEQLLAELIRYRRICAQLRARLEHDTTLVKLKQQQQQQRPLTTISEGGGALLAAEGSPNPAATNSLLVTRF